MKFISITLNRYKKICKELVRLKTIERSKILKLIKDASQHGDLSENSEYHSAKAEQFILEKKIYNLYKKISRIKIINISRKSFTVSLKVVFGTTMLLMNLDIGIIKNWTIVGEEETNVYKKKISINSPMVGASIGKKILEKVYIRVLGEIRRYKIVFLL